tara:strand:+ start:1231 stop:2862 length:1632 start_codon:yes stop_codon:yes gene_type:complete
MALTLRTNKGSALSYEEMDINFSSLIYSASVSEDLKVLTLHYSGSSLQSAGGIDIALNTYTGSSEVAGNVNTFQYNLDGTNFAGAAGLVYDAAKLGVAIGTSSLETGEKLRVEGGSVVLDDSTFVIAQGAASASLSYGGTTKDITIQNHFADNNADIIFKTKGAEVLRLKGDGSITHKGASNSLGDFVVSGSFIFGKTHEDTYRSKLFTWDSGNPRVESNTGNNLLIGNERGIILEGPQTGHVIMGIQSTTGNEAFAILSAPPTGSNEPTYKKLIANFAANGKVGIGTSSPKEILHVVGNITGSGNIEVNGTAKIGGIISGSTDAYISGSTTLSGSVTLNTVANAASATNYNYLVRESSGAVTKQVNAAPIPQGGIIMWSGAVQSLPSGWNLCDGGTYNSVVTPDLKNKFLVGSNNTTGTPTTTISGSAVSTGGATTHSHGDNTNNHVLTFAQMPQHTHQYKDSYYIEINNPGVGANGAIGGVDYLGGTKYKGSGDSDTDNKYVYWRGGTTAQTGNSTAHNHGIDSDFNLPPYFALAYIMYTG